MYAGPTGAGPLDDGQGSGAFREKFSNRAEPALLPGGLRSKYTSSTGDKASGNGGRGGGGKRHLETNLREAEIRGRGHGDFKGKAGAQKPAGSNGGANFGPAAEPGAGDHRVPPRLLAGIEGGERAAMKGGGARLVRGGGRIGAPKSGGIGSVSAEHREGGDASIWGVGGLRASGARGYPAEHCPWG